MKNKKAKIAIIGAGVAGSSTALYLSELGLDVTLFEKEQSIVNGPPFCHLHAGGNLYREISDEQCIKLLKQSIDFLKFYPFIVDYRPTVIALPTTDASKVEDLLPRLDMLTKEYEALINKDKSNQVLGKISDYYALYTKEEIFELKEKELVDRPKTADEWMIPVAKNIDIDKIQFPLILVQEYGLNLFRLASGLTLSLEKSNNATLLVNTVVSNIQENCNLDSWRVTYVKDNVTEHENFDYIVNAAGFRSGKIDDLIGVECKRMVEFKAAYVSKWAKTEDNLWPELIFHGERGTPRGMGQFTPYPGGYIQLHGMTKEITLYEDGLVSNSTVSCQPHLKENFIKKIDKSWNKEEIEKRTLLAIKHISQFIPAFASATVGSKPLYGAQQIPGNDPTLRVAEVSFPKSRYARCEIVKVSSTLDMLDAITKELVKLNFIDANKIGKRDFLVLKELVEKEIISVGEKICEEREYPKSLAHRNAPYAKW